MTIDELKAWRKKNSFTQVKLAEKLGVTNICVSRWETGERKIPSFLSLALDCMEKKGVHTEPAADTPKRKEGSENGRKNSAPKKRR